MTNPTPSEISQALGQLQAAGYTWNHQDDGQLHEHLARHAPDSLTVGSKYSQEAWADLDALHKLASDLSIVALAKAHQEGKPLRVEIIIPYPHAGFEGVASSLVCAGLSTITRVSVLRDPGTPYQQKVELVVVADDQDFPVAQQLIAPAGIFGDTKELGLYTLFPGSASRPFPREDQAVSDPVFHAANVAFWRDHFFLATPKQAITALESGIAVLKNADTPTQEVITKQQDDLLRLKSILASYETAAHTRPRP